MSPSCTNLLTQQGETHLSIILLLLQVTFCHNLPWCKTIGLWAGNLQLQVCGYWQGRGEDNLQQISQMSCLEHRVQTSHLTFPKFINFQACGVASLPWQAPGGWLAPQRGSEAREQRALCSVTVYKHVHTQLPPQNKSQSPARSQCCLSQCPFSLAGCARYLPITCQPYCWEKNGDTWNKESNYSNNFVSIFCLGIYNTS